MNSDLYNTTAMLTYSNGEGFQIDEEVVKLCFTMTLMTWFMVYVLKCCRNPLEDKLIELEADLDTAETTICRYEEEIEMLTNKLKDMSHRYENCRSAAQEFIGTFPETTQEPKMKRSRVD